MEDTTESRPFRHSRAGATWPHRDCGSIQRTSMGLDQMGSQYWAGKWAQPPIPNPEATCNWQPLVNEKLVFSKSISVGIQTIIKGSPRPQQEMLNRKHTQGIFAGSSPHNVKSRLFWFCLLFLLILQVLCVYIKASYLCFYRIPECANLCVSAPYVFLAPFSLVPFLILLFYHILVSFY